MMNRKNINGKNIFKILLLTVGILLANSGFAAAQENKQEKVKISADEAKAVKKIEEAKTLDEKTKLISEFVKKYPQSAARIQAADYLAAQIAQTKNDSQIVTGGETYLTIFTEPAEADFILPSLIFSYNALKRPKDAFAVAEKYLARHPEDVTVRTHLAVEGSNLLRTGNKDFAAPARNYAAQAIEMIEANKKPANIDDAGWKEYQTRWLPQLYQSIGVIDFMSGDTAKARVSLEKAAQLDSSDVNTWILLATFVDDEYQELAKKYNVASPGAERDATLKQANEKMDQVIEMYARIVALTEGKAETKALNEQVRQNLEGYYKYRHKSLDGLNELIGKYKKTS